MGHAVDAVGQVDLDIGDVSSERNRRERRRREIERVAAAGHKRVTGTKNTANVDGGREVDHVANHGSALADAIQRAQRILVRVGGVGALVADESEEVPLLLLEVRGVDEARVLLVRDQCSSPRAVALHSQRLENLVDDGLVVEDTLDTAVVLRSVEVVARLVGVVTPQVAPTERVQVLVHTLNPLGLVGVERRPTLSRRAVCQRIAWH